MDARTNHTETNPAKTANASITALSVHAAFVRAIETNYNSPALFSKDEHDFAKYMLNTALAHESTLAWGIWQAPYTLQKRLFDHLVSPGYDNRILARKYFIKNKINHSIKHDGVEQVVILGGGYDIRGFFTFLDNKDNKKIQVFELDQPGKTRDIKLKAIANDYYFHTFANFQKNSDQLSFSVSDQLHLIECNIIADNLETKLLTYGFDKNKKTLVIAEGLTMYLDEKTNIDLLQKQLFPLLALGSEIIISYMSSTVNSNAANQLQTSRNESYLFAVLPTAAPDFAAKAGFNLTGKMLASDLLTLADDQEHADLLTKDQTMPDGRGRESYFCFKKTIQSINDTGLIQNPPIDDIEIMDTAVLKQQAYTSCGIV